MYDCYILRKFVLAAVCIIFCLLLSKYVHTFIDQVVHDFGRVHVLVFYDKPNTLAYLANVARSSFFRILDENSPDLTFHDHHVIVIDNVLAINLNLFEVAIFHQLNEVIQIVKSLFELGFRVAHLSYYINFN